MFVRHDALKRSGSFDEEYFMYTEHTDLCYRLKKNGWQIWYIPSREITHFGGASSTDQYPIISEFKGIKLFYKKYYPVWQYKLLRVILKLGAFIRIIIFGILQGRKAVKTYVEAFIIA